MRKLYLLAATLTAMIVLTGCGSSEERNHPLFKKGENELIIFETDGLRENKAEFIDHPDHAPAMEMVR